VVRATVQVEPILPATARASGRSGEDRGANELAAGSGREMPLPPKLNFILCYQAVRAKWKMELCTYAQVCTKEKVAKRKLRRLVTSTATPETLTSNIQGAAPTSHTNS